MAQTPRAPITITHTVVDPRAALSHRLQHTAIFSQRAPSVYSAFPTPNHHHLAPRSPPSSSHRNHLTGATPIATIFQKKRKKRTTTTTTEQTIERKTKQRLWRPRPRAPKPGCGVARELSLSHFLRSGLSYRAPVSHSFVPLFPCPPPPPSTASMALLPSLPPSLGLPFRTRLACKAFPLVPLASGG